MNPRFRPLAALLLSAALLFSCPLTAWGAQAQTPLEESAAFVRAAVPSPQVSSTGGEWAVIGLARSGLEVPRDWYQGYLDNLEAFTLQAQGVLSSRKYTEYARVVLALTALGEDPRDVAGYDLLSPLFDLEQVVRQGVNGAAYALIALDSGAYPAPDGLREAYLAYLLEAQLPDGGWALSGEKADPDVTAQVLQALAPYRLEAEEAAASGFSALEALWGQGGFPTLEGCAQAIIALCAFDRAPWDGLVDAFLGYRLPDGSFRHLPGGQWDLMATEQGLCALSALARSQAGQSALYQMAQPGAGQGGDTRGLSPEALLGFLFLLPSCVLGLGLPCGE